MYNISIYIDKEGGRSLKILLSINPEYVEEIFSGKKSMNFVELFLKSRE